MLVTATKMGQCEELCCAIEACGGVDDLERLQQHENESVYNMALHIIEQFFSVEVSRNKSASIIYEISMENLFSSRLLESSCQLAQLLMTPLWVQEVWGPTPRPVKSDTVADGSPPLRRVLCYLGAKPHRWTLPLVARFGVIVKENRFSTFSA